MWSVCTLGRLDPEDQLMRTTLKGTLGLVGLCLQPLFTVPK